MYKKVAVFLFVLLIVLPLTVAAQAPQQTLPAPIPQEQEIDCCTNDLHFHGTVKDTGGNGLKDVVMGLLTADGATVLDKDKTAANGKFNLEYQPPCFGDQYLVREIDPPGYQSVSAIGPGVTLDLNTIGTTITSCAKVTGFEFVDGPKPTPDPCAPGVSGPASVCVKAIGADGQPADRARVWIYNINPGFLVVMGYGETGPDGKVTITTNGPVYRAGEPNVLFSVRHPYTEGNPTMPIDRYSTNSTKLYPGTLCCQNDLIFINYEAEIYLWQE